MTIVLWAFALALQGISSRPAVVPSAAPAYAAEASIYLRSTPSARRLIADWEPSDLLVVTYTSYWPEVLTALVEQGRQAGQVAVLVPKEASTLTVRGWVQTLAEPNGRLNPVDVIAAGTDTTWVRDYGPLQVREGDRVIWLDAPYVYRPGDDDVPALLGARYRVDVESIPEQIEGGAIVSNGAGLCVSTEEAFRAARIDRSDAPGMDMLLGQIGCSALALVPALSDDPTHHADMFLQFISADAAILAEPDPVLEPEDALRMDAAARIVADAAALLGQRIDITRIPLPIGGDGVYFTYLNGLQLDDTFLVPQYDAVPEEVEDLAYARLADAMPHRTLVPVPADELIRLQGAVHCITLTLRLPQDPRTRRARRPDWDMASFEARPRGLRRHASLLGPAP